MSKTMETTTRQGGLGMRTAMRIAASFHCAIYRASGGKLGGTANGAPLALLTTRGRKSGRALTRPVAYVTDGDTLLLVASVGGMPWNPGWYYNLRADPRVTITIGRQSRAMIAEPLAGQHRERGWEHVVREYPIFTRYQQKVARQIPVVRLRPAPGE
jgi:deazaflavin-dependent oxidoreductase (nitroreductase family)